MSQNINSYKIGDLVSLKIHPFIEKSNNIYIQSKAEYTPPILNIFEVLIPEVYNEETGEKDIQYQCIYYSTKSGVFEKKWFKHKELKLLKEEDIEFTNDDLRGRIGKKVILKSVDLELGKKKSHLEIDKTLIQKKNYHLDFLPPLLQIIGVEENEEKRLYSKKTGEQVKTKYSLKVKWFNPVKDKFSEDILPPSVLKEVTINESLLEIINVEDCFKYRKITIDSNKIIDDIVEIKGIYFNTYSYKVEIKSSLTQKVDYIDLNEFDGIEKIENNIFSEEILGINENKYIELEPALFSNNILYKIKYKDNFGRITERIIYIEKILYFDKDYSVIEESNLVQKKNDVKYSYIEAKCFLRDLEIRHFKIDSDHIISVKKVEILIEDNVV